MSKKTEGRGRQTSSVSKRRFPLRPFPKRKTPSPPSPEEDPPAQQPFRLPEDPRRHSPRAKLEPARILVVDAGGKTVADVVRDTEMLVKADPRETGAGMSDKSLKVIVYNVSRSKVQPAARKQRIQHAVIRTLEKQRRIPSSPAVQESVQLIKGGLPSGVKGITVGTAKIMSHGKVRIVQVVKEVNEA